MDFHTVVKPFLYLVKFLGLFPATVRVKSSKFISTTTKFDKLFSAFMASLPVLGISYICFDLQSEEGLGGLQEVWVVIAQYGILIPAISVGHQLWNYQTIVELFEKILKFDEDCRCKRIFVNHEKHSRWVKFALIEIFVIFLCLSLMFIFIGASRMQSSLKMATSHFTQVFYINFFAVQFILVASCAACRYRELNNGLETNNIRTKYDVKETAKLYDDLLNIIQMINSTFSFSVIFMLASEFVMGTFVLYTQIVFFRNPRNDSEYWFGTCTNCTLLILQVVLATLVSCFGNKVLEESQRTFELLTRKINNSYNEDVNNELVRFMLQLKCRSKGLENIFFTIDWRMMFGVSRELRIYERSLAKCSSIFIFSLQMFSTVVTYFLITIQFYKFDEQKTFFDVKYQ